MIEVVNRRRASGRVLVVDDEPVLRRAFSRVLRQVGYDVEEAEDGTSAKAKISASHFDAVVSDISMPDMTGIDVLRHVHGRDGDLPVVLVTGGQAVETAVEAIENGVFRYLIKPVAADDLIRAVDRGVLLYRMACVRRDLTAKLGGEDRTKLAASLDRALATLWMAYQPIVRPDGTLFGYEALMRTNEPSLPHPGAVIEAAEQLGRLVELGRTVRHAAAASFHPEDPGLSLFLNLHTRDLLDDELSSPHGALSKIPHRVVLEITERASLHEVSDVRARIETLKGLGYGIAIDDLGSGYAGLNSFALLEPEVVKIDLELVRDIDKSPMKRRLVASMIALCKEMGMLVVGEGVETEAERDVLVELGCPLLQGYLFGRPARLPNAA